MHTLLGLHPGGPGPVLLLGADSARGGWGRLGVGSLWTILDYETITIVLQGIEWKILELGWGCTRRLERAETSWASLTLTFWESPLQGQAGWFLWAVGLHWVRWWIVIGAETLEGGR